jgi:hypothetical protein
MDIGRGMKIVSIAALVALIAVLIGATGKLVWQDQ